MKQFDVFATFEDFEAALPNYSLVTLGRAETVTRELLTIARTYPIHYHRAPGIERELEAIRREIARRVAP